MEPCLVADFDVVGEADLDLVAVDLRREAAADLAGETGAFLALFLLVSLTGLFVLSSLEGGQLCQLFDHDIFCSQKKKLASD